MHEYPNRIKGRPSGRVGDPKYVNAVERRRFVKASTQAVAEVRLFCLTLLLSGGRISEILALTPASIDLDSRVVSIHDAKTS
ncbi:hypothetical protein [Bradyrhizobium sp. CCGUVB23]|uniref:hypothetical protein n=1 Tax=Bradyrhizobium sp. CCGUVB23 TaxID=2949630 RepID=UPI0020B1C7EA|nr:hypothetical protein [Bradyrhizobium sp. CCGUVB23]MCP3460408.1 hypothetical protein [Bradyrhizobium sp. CCGUVB23]